MSTVGAPLTWVEPGSGCAAMGGENRGHAIFGGGPSCIKAHPSDLAVALAALDAAVPLYGPRAPAVCRSATSPPCPARPRTPRPCCTGAS